LVDQDIKKYTLRRRRRRPCCRLALSKELVSFFTPVGAQILKFLFIS
jgi:hypothetical protein